MVRVPGSWSAWVAGVVCAVGVAACGGGGGGGGSSIQVGFQDASSTLDEGDVGSLAVVLTTPAPLVEAASVTVSDAAVGTAVAGADYTAPSGTVVTFPAGSVDGATQFVAITGLGDGLVEAQEETLRLRLSGPSSGVGLSQPVHDVALRDQNAATVLFAQAASATPDEADATYDAAVELMLAPGDSLAVPVSVTVRDGETGSATPGGDYAAVSPVTLTFAAGSTDGETLLVEVSVIDDTDTETDETIVLTLDPPSSAAFVALGQNEHVLTITEDELVTAPHLHVNVNDGGADSSLGHGGLLDLGSQPLGAGPTAGMKLTLSNLGTTEMNLSQLTLSGDVGDFAIELLAGGAELSAELPTITPFPFEVLGEDALQGVHLRLDPLQAEALLGASAAVLHNVPLPGGELIAVDLERRELPFTDDAVLSVDGALASPGDAVADLSLWRGTVVGEPESRVFLALSSIGSNGFVRRESGASYELISEGADAGALPESRLIPSAILAEQVAPASFSCVELAPPTAPAVAHTPAPDAMTVGLSVAECRLAIETDHQLFQRFGSVSATTTYISELIAAVSDQYLEDLQVELSIAYLGVYSSSADPWSSQDGGGSTGALLDEFQDAWNLSGWPAAADLAHFISGANLGGGIAYVDVLCNPFFGYGVSANITGGIDWSGWTGQPTSNSWDFVVVAHELGHNFGTSHTHSYCPPLDPCASNCESASGCPEGTIMSYCHACGGMANIRPEFHPQVANVLREEIGASCLGGTTLAGGGAVEFQVRFEPNGGLGTKSATLGFTHDGTNTASPFQADLTGDAQ